MKDGERLGCIWENGGYVNSTGGAEEFLNDFYELVKHYGTPSRVEIRQQHEGWIHGCDSSDETSCEDSAR
jgi:hypothetical protein